jgi:transcriptional regulator with XRE-family HTH domain
MYLDQKQIGKKIANLRKLKGLSQEDLARQIGISRSSLTQIELGNRGVDIKELQKLAMELKFSYDEFLSAETEKIDMKVSEPIAAYKLKAPLRISRPETDPDKFRNVLLYILEKCAGKANVGETVLSKLLYFSDFNYYELYEEHLTSARYKKMPFGPVPVGLDIAINEMIESLQIQRIKTEYFGYPQTRFIPLVKPDLTMLKASEAYIIDKVIEQMGDWSASGISEYSHKDMPWVATKEGDEIDYELVFYREAPFSVRNYENPKG